MSENSISQAVKNNHQLKPVLDVVKNGMSIGNAGKKHKIPKSTLAKMIQRYKRGEKIHPKTGRRPKVNEETKSKIQSKIMEHARLGNTLTIKDTKKLIFQSYKEQKLKEPGFEGDVNDCTLSDTTLRSILDEFRIKPKIKRMKKNIIKTSAS